MYHWRYQIPALAKTRPVYALDLVGFGLSDKPLVDYSADLWRDQVGDFLKEIVKQKSVLAGNSLGGFTALYASSANTELVEGCVLLNAAGRFQDPNSPNEARDEEPGWLARLAETVKSGLTKAVIYASFFVTVSTALGPFAVIELALVF